MNKTALLKEYFASTKAVQLATVSNGLPWICTVYYVADEANNLYWMSARNRQHSREIISNPTVAATIVKDVERKQALQITGQAREVETTEVEKVNALYEQKFGPKGYDLDAIKQPDPNGRAFWVFQPDTISFWDEVNFPDAPKQTVELD